MKRIKFVKYEIKKFFIRIVDKIKLTNVRGFIRKKEYDRALDELFSLYSKSKVSPNSLEALKLQTMIEFEKQFGEIVIITDR